MNHQIMTDMELQSKCIEFGSLYVAEFHPGISDLEKKAWMQNAAAAGFAAGWRQAMEIAASKIKDILDRAGLDDS